MFIAQVSQYVNFNCYGTRGITEYLSVAISTII